jgi:hypothetical protein
MSTQDVSQSLPSLFDPPPSATVSNARSFVKWCCSFGDGFRNSPDIANLRYWAQKNKVHIATGEESVVLEAARALFLRRIEHLTQNSEAAN